MRVEIENWLAVATWKWDIPADACTICMNQFEEPCTRCKFGGDDCPMVEGECGHFFHIHCIQRWLDN